MVRKRFDIEKEKEKSKKNLKKAPRRLEEQKC